MRDDATRRTGADSGSNGPLQASRAEMAVCAEGGRSGYISRGHVSSGSLMRTEMGRTTRPHKQERPGSKRRGGNVASTRLWRKRRRKSRMDRVVQVAIALPLLVLVATVYSRGQNFFADRNEMRLETLAHKDAGAANSAPAYTIDSDSALHTRSTRRRAVQNDNSSFPDDMFTNKERESGAFLLHCIGMLYTFFALAIVCDEFFVPSLEVIVARLGIPEDVAGATFMAAGGSAPELWTSFIGLFVSKDEVGFGTIVGSAVFNILFVIGSCAFASSSLLTLTWWPLSRDVFFYATALILLTIFFYDDKIYLYEGGAMFAVYVAYVIFMLYNEDMQKRAKAALRRLRGDTQPKGGDGVSANSTATTMVGEPKYNENKVVPVDDETVVAKNEHGQGVFDGVPEGKGTTFVARPREDSLQVISVQAKSPAAEPNDKSGVGASKLADSSRSTRPRGFSDTTQDGEPQSPRSGDGGDVGIEGEKYFAEGEVKGRKKRKPSFEDGERRSSTGMLRHMKVTKGSHGQDHDRDMDSMVHAEARRGRRMSECGRNLFIEQQVAEKRKSYAPLLHEGGTSMARQRFQISVMKAMIWRTDVPGERVRRASLTVVEQSKFDKAARRVNEDLGKGADSHCISVKSKTEGVSPTKDGPGGFADSEMAGTDDEGDENDALDLSFPEDPFARFMYIITVPITYSLYYTVPDVRIPDRENFYLASFILSIFWIILYTFCMVWWATVIGDTLGIPSVIMGLTILAAGTSVPDLLTSVIVAKRGHGDMAVSSSIGSNLFDVCIGLPIPWIIYILVYNEPVEVGTNLILISVAILFIMLIATISTIAINKWQMTKTMGVMMFFLYIIFMIIMIVLDNYA